MTEEKKLMQLDTKPRPSISLEEFVPTETWEPAGEFVLTPELNQYFMDCLDDHQPWYTEDSPCGGPIVSPAVLHEVAFFCMTRRFNVRVKESLHAKQDSILHRSVKVGTKVRVEVRAAEKYIRRNKNYIVHEARVWDESGQLVLTSRHHRMVGRRE